MKRSYSFVFIILSCVLISGPSALASDLADALVFVCGNGDLEKARFLIDVRHADVNGRNDMGFSPLWSASKNGHLPIVKLLIEKKAGINARAWEGETPLIAAAAAGQTPIVKYLIENGSDETLRDGSGWTARKWAEVREHEDTYRYLAAYDALHYTHAYLVRAICTGNLRQIQEVIPNRLAVNFRGLRKNYMPPLSIAVKEGQHKIARWLIDKGADVNLAASNGATPLSTAVERGDRKMVEFLLANDARVSEQEGTRAALDLARQKGLSEIVSLLEARKAEEELIREKTDECMAITKELDKYRGRRPGELNDSEAKEAIALIRKIAEIEAQVPSKKLGSMRFSVDFRRPLFGLDDEKPQIRLSDSPPKLINVVTIGNIDGARELIRSGADINERNGIQETPLFAAVMRKPDFGDSDGRCSKTIALLLDKGADVNAADLAGRTPLMMAAGAGDIGIVRLLLSKGASIEALDSEGSTALAVAQKKGHGAVVQALEKAASKKPAAVSASKRRAAPAEEDE